MWSSRYGSTTSATAPTSSGPTSARAARTSRTPSRSASRRPKGAARVLWCISEKKVELWARSRTVCGNQKFYGAFVLNHRVFLHAIDATPARWRGDASSLPLDRARTAARNDLHPKHWLTCAQVTKYLVYNMRKRQEGGDKAKEYECGVIFTPLTPSTRPTWQVFQLHSKCCWCSRYAFSSSDAGRAALARHHEDPQLY